MLFQTSLLISVAALLSHVQCAPASDQLSARKFKTSIAVGAGAVAGCAVAGCYDDDSDDSAPEVWIDPGTAPTNEAQITCSAKDGTHKDVVPGADSPAWVKSMKACLGQLNTDNWVENQSCQPNEGVVGGPVLGPATFGFYSKGHDWRDMRNCYQKCSPCLAEGIDNHWAVTTSCKYDAGGGSLCEMGFNYGE
ncbi:MAG: hypothetical protein Q9184_006915 [Pyrenodesmia sp. 2 TL-2023]